MQIPATSTGTPVPLKTVIPESRQSFLGTVNAQTAAMQEVVAARCSEFLSPYEAEIALKYNEMTALCSRIDRPGGELEASEADGCRAREWREELAANLPAMKSKGFEVQCSPRHSGAGPSFGLNYTRNDVPEALKQKGVASIEYRIIWTGSACMEFEAAAMGEQGSFPLYILDVDSVTREDWQWGPMADTRFSLSWEKEQWWSTKGSCNSSVGSVGCFGGTLAGTNELTQDVETERSRRMPPEQMVAQMTDSTRTFVSAALEEFGLSDSGWILGPDR